MRPHGPVPFAVTPGDWWISLIVFLVVYDRTDRAMAWSLGHRSFAVAGPTTWNSLSADLRDPTCSDESFRRSLKTFLFAKY